MTAPDRLPDNFCESCAGPLATCDCVNPRPTRVRYAPSKADCADTIERLERERARIARLTEALRELVRLKDHKDANGTDEGYLLAKGSAWGRARAILAASTRQVEAEPVGSPAWPWGTPVRIEHDGFAGTVIGKYQRLDGYEGRVVQQEGTKVVHVYGLKWLQPADTHPAPNGLDAATLALCISECQEIADAATTDMSELGALRCRDALRALSPKESDNA